MALRFKDDRREKLRVRMEITPIKKKTASARIKLT